ncbi:MAG: SPOR domain-containing protein [Magnetococcales bacterium]|nr:SPOR domain-containing protein [Magnetococcales bacterium]
MLGLIGGCLPVTTPESTPASPPAKPAARLLLHPFHEIGTPADLEKAHARVQSFLVGRSQERFGLNYLEAGSAEVDPRSQSGMERLMALGITHLLTGRMKPPPNGFFLVELYEPPRTEPTLVRDVPIDSGTSLEAVVDMVMTELEERFKKENVTVLLGRKPGQEATGSSSSRPTPLERSQKNRLAEKGITKKSEVTPTERDTARREYATRREGTGTSETTEESSDLGKSTVSDPKGTRGTASALAEGSRDKSSVAPARETRETTSNRPTRGTTRSSEESERGEASKKSQGSYRFAIQAAAAPSTQDFEQTATKIRRKGYRTMVHATRNRKGKQWYFLWVGRYASREKAKEALFAFRKRVRDVPVFITPIDDDRSDYRIKQKGNVRRGHGQDEDEDEEE